MSSQVLVDAKNVAGQPMNGATVGYAGCGKKATYVYVRISRDVNTRIAIM
jgi:hypothetical protein